MKELSVGVIGCGMLAQATHLAHLNEIDGARLTWACDINAQTLALVQEKFRPRQTTDDYMKIINDPAVDAIVIATAQDLRLPVIAAAAKAGKGIYCEKPMANSLAEMEKIRRVVEDAKIVFCVGHNRRSSPSMMYAREVFANQRRHPAPCPWRFDRNPNVRKPWPEESQAYVMIRINDDLLSWKAWALTDETMAHGPILFEMTHFTDLACWFLELRPVRVTAVGHLRTNQTVVIEFEDGSLANILMTGVGTFGYPKELYELYAQGSAVVLDHFVEVRTAGMEGMALRTTFPLYKDPYPAAADGGGIRDFYAKRRQAELRAMEAGDPVVGMEQGPEPDKGHKSHLARFLDAVRGQGASPCPCADSILATRIAFAAVESLKTGRGVDL